MCVCLCVLASLGVRIQNIKVHMGARKNSHGYI